MVIFTCSKCGPACCSVVHDAVLDLGPGFADSEMALSSLPGSPRCAARRYGENWIRPERVQPFAGACPTVCETRSKSSLMIRHATASNKTYFTSSGRPKAINWANLKLLIRVVAKGKGSPETHWAKAVACLRYLCFHPSQCTECQIRRFQNHRES